MHYRSHSKLSGIIASLGVHRFERHISYNWSSGKWGDGRRKWSITWCLHQFLEGSSKLITYRGYWASSICARRPFQVWVGGYWKKDFSKVPLIQDIFRLFWAKLFFCIHYLEKLAWLTCYHCFSLFNYLLKNQVSMIFQETSFMNFLSNLRYDL